MKVAITEVEWLDNTIEFNIHLLLLIFRDRITCYSYPAYGYPDEQLTIVNSKKDRSGLRIELPNQNWENMVFIHCKKQTGVSWIALNWHDPNAERRLQKWILILRLVSRAQNHSPNSN
ncbi:MAG: hypothetical protein CM1200mP10_08390 [Candidatus Neomarinimicrobiota bacterium]|nr:MAG: hypothetical protein CM1200mP10_08390 [Candidatus Neomarinimicrobiota bacterium]